MIELNLISPQEVHKKTRQGEDFLFLDVRKETEITEGKIFGSILLPPQEILNRVEAFIPDKKSLVVVYCRNGIRAEIAAENMKLLGYSRVYILDGGINAWKKENLPVIFPGLEGRGSG